jgi:hypothetical protein
MDDNTRVADTNSERIRTVPSCWMRIHVFKSVLRIRIHRIHIFLGFPDTDPLVRGMDPDPDPSIIMQK